MDPFSPTFDPFAAADNKTRRQDHVVYNNASLNSSAPMLSLAQDPGLTQRSVTSPMPKKRLNWAPECAIYHTFHATEYDRRSEPATCNRLTPSLAQEIKDELNGYKMEEMAVHPSSRVHTHFLYVQRLFPFFMPDWRLFKTPLTLLPLVSRQYLSWLIP